MIEIEVTIDIFGISAGTFKYTTPIRVPLVKVLVKVAVKGPGPWRVEFAVEVAELAEE